MVKICEGWMVTMSGERLYYRRAFKRGNCWVFQDFPEWPKEEPIEFEFECDPMLAGMMLP